MMRLEELKREKIANEDMEVFPDGKRTQIFHTQIEGFTKLKTWTSGCRKQKQGKKNTRDSPRSENLVRFGNVWYGFCFQPRRFWKELSTPSFGDRCQTLFVRPGVRPIKKSGSCKSGHVGKKSGKKMHLCQNLCHVWETSTYAFFCFRLAAWLSEFSRSTSWGSPWPNTFKHAKNIKKRHTPSIIT